MAREWTEEQKQQARERELARRTQTETTIVESEPSTETNPNDALLALISDLTDKIGALESKLAQKESQAPRMIPMGAMDVPNIGTVATGMRGGDERNGVGAQLPIASRGLRLHDDIFRQFDQTFEAGQRVRLNPESVRQGGSQSWGEILERLGTVQCPTKVGRRTCNTPLQVGDICRRCGVGPTVQGVRYLNKNGEWKYIVRVPGLTARQGKGDGFAQSELLPA